MSANTVAKIIVNQIFYKYNFFKNLASDLGSNFMSKLSLAICEMFNMRKISSSSYAPSTQGSIERFNSFVHASLRRLLKTRSDWPSHLPAVQFAYNSTISKGHQFCPSFIYFCHESSSLLDLNLDVALENVNFNARFNLQEFINQAHYARELVKENILTSQASMKEYFDRTAKNIKYELNDLVLLHNTRSTHAQPKKLSQNFLGPFFIHEVLPNNAYRLVHFESGKTLKFPVNGRRLKLAHLPSESRIRSALPNRINNDIAQRIRERARGDDEYTPPGGGTVKHLSGNK